MIVFAQSSRIVLLATLDSLENTTQKKTADKMLKTCSCKTTGQNWNTRESDDEVGSGQRSLARNLISIGSSPVAGLLSNQLLFGALFLLFVLLYS